MSKYYPQILNSSGREKKRGGGRDRKRGRMSEGTELGISESYLYDIPTINTNINRLGQLKQHTERERERERERE